MSPILPEFPSNINNLQDAERWKRLEYAWNESQRILALFLNEVPHGVIGDQYTVSGTIPASVTLDMTSITATAVAQTMAKLLHDLRLAGILNVVEKP
jgi:hypothetical protein